jgi:tRNA modification GTPase
MLSQGVRVALAGPPNVGKSSLLNALCGEERAIVDERAGTTRDWLEVRVQVEGFLILLYDTAGLRAAEGVVEAEGVRRALGLVRECDLLLLVLDPTAPLEEAALAALREAQADCLIVVNKSDLVPLWNDGDLARTVGRVRPEWGEHGMLEPRVAHVSALGGTGIRELLALVLDVALRGRAAELEDAVVLTRARHEEAVRGAYTSLERALETFTAKRGAEWVAMDLGAAVTALGEVVGMIPRAEVMEEIFRRFCIGK